MRRLNTVTRVFRYSAGVVVVLVAGTLILGELGISIAPILATAGVAGVAIGFGAQSLIKDYLSGFFLLLEDHLRDGDGYVHFVPNGEIKHVVNRTRNYAYAMIDTAVSGRQDVEPALATMREVAAALRKDPKFGPCILEDVEIFGVERWELWGLGLRCRIKTLPHERDSVRREFLKRLAGAFEAHGIKTP